MQREMFHIMSLFVKHHACYIITVSAYPIEI